MGTFRLSEKTIRNNKEANARLCEASPELTPVLLEALEEGYRQLLSVSDLIDWKIIEKAKRDRCRLEFEWTIAEMWKAIDKAKRIRGPLGEGRFKQVVSVKPNGEKLYY